MDGVVAFVIYEDGKPSGADWRKRIVRVAVARLNRIVARTGAKVVVSSTWRYVDGRPGEPEERGFTAIRMQFILEEMGFRGEVIGITPALPGAAADVRGLEIRAWLDAQADLPRGLAILDDWPLMPALWPWLVRTSYDHLLTDNDVEAAVEMLQMPFPVRRWRAASALAGESTV
jgi:hypothetical protein